MDFPVTRSVSSDTSLRTAAVDSHTHTRARTHTHTHIHANTLTHTGIDQDVPHVSGEVWPQAAEGN